LFFRAVSRALMTKATFIGCTVISYYDDSRASIDLRSPLAKLHPSQLKGGKTYANQIEARGVWVPSISDAIQHIDIDVPDAIKYCCRHRQLK
jgi:hypothetical protein